MSSGRYLKRSRIPGGTVGEEIEHQEVQYSTLPDKEDLDLQKVPHDKSMNSKRELMRKSSNCRKYFIRKCIHW